jgi:hypothetical protein
MASARNFLGVSARPWLVFGDPPVRFSVTQPAVSQSFGAAASSTNKTGIPSRTG